MEYSKARRLAEIIVRLRIRKVTAEERAFLNDWLDESEANRQTYKRIVRGESIARRLKTEETIQSSTDFAQITEQIAQRLTRKHRRPWRIGAWSAAAAIVAATVGYFTFFHKPEPAFVPYAVERVVAAATPIADAKVLLVTADGKQFDLEKELPDSLNAGQSFVRNEKGQLVYEQKGTPSPSKIREEWHKVITSIGGEYFVRLGDGTRVWLNANTELEFPAEFVADKRIVRLKGEAYFEVARDTRKPFIVETAGLHTKVLGTSFNVKAYPDETDERTTLLEGRVEVSLAQAPDGTPIPRTELTPGMQAQWETGSEALAVKAVNPTDAIAWRRGEFVFNDEDIQVVLQTLSRWYGVEFISTNTEDETYTFSGMMSKDDQLSSTLEILTLAGGPVFRIDGKKVYMSKNKSGL